jgi:hypothetical protein
MLVLPKEMIEEANMVNRRTVLKIGATALTGTVVNVPVFQHAASTRPHDALQRAVFDDRFAECQAFATKLESAGAVTSAVRGDVAKLWYEDLRASLSNNKRALLAGLTDRPALFCLEELARDVGMRVIFRADHITEQNGHTQHAAVGLASLVAVARNLPQENGFGRAVAALFSQFDFSGLNISGAGDTSAQKRTGPFSPENKTALVSWLIA